MRRVVVTGMGIWSCIGQDLQTVTESLRQGRSGIIFDPKRIEYGLRSGLVGNVPRPDLKPLLPRKFRATMSEDAEYAYMATRQAFEQAGISDEYLHQNEVGIIFGSDYMTNGKIESARIIAKEKNSLMIEPNALFKCETSSVSMNLSSIFHLRGISFCVGAACASSLLSTGIGMTLIKEGKQDIIVVGGANEISPHGAALLDVIDGLSLNNSDPTAASRPFDIDRDGLVTSGGGATLILEEYEHALKRGCKPLFEILGYGCCADGHYLAKDYKNYVRAMQRALDDAGVGVEDVEYINSAASGGVWTDVYEATSLTKLFADRKVWISSTESTTGHEHNMAGVSKTIYTYLMMQNNFIAQNENIKVLIPEARSLRIVRSTIHQSFNIAMINNTGLGGVNCSLIISKI